MSQFKAGFARLDITPPLGVHISGYYKVRIADGILDPLEVQCIAVSDGESTALLYNLDVAGIKQIRADIFRNAISAATGVHYEGIFLTCTHTHTGPVIGIPGTPDADEAYIAFLCRKLCDAGVLAIADLTPATASYARGEAPKVSFVRRFRMKDGYIRTNPGVGNPEIAHPIGSSDDMVQVLRLTREGKDEIVVVNFQVHPDTIGGCKFSADWPGFTRRELEQALPGSKCIFFNGAQGDVNHIDVRIPSDGFNGGYEYSRHMGRVIAGTVLQVFDKVKYVDVDSLRYKQTTIHVPAKRPTPEQIKEAKIIKELHETGRDNEIPYSGMMHTTVVAEALHFVELEHGPEFFDMDLSCVAIGNIALIGIPGEGFTGIGMGLKEAEGWDLILPTCLTNGKHGYFPMQDAFDEGGYESRSSKFKAGVAEYMIEEGKKLMAELH